jgi:monosaccharide-transporting ATPase
VLLLDEPTRGIDVGAKAEVQALIDELAAEGLGVVLVSSDAEELIEGSDRVVVLRDGAVVGELRGDEVTVNTLMGTIAAAAPEPAEAPPGRAPGGSAAAGEESDGV